MDLKIPFFFNGLYNIFLIFCVYWPSLDSFSDIVSTFNFSAISTPISAIKQIICASKRAFATKNKKLKN